MDRIYRPRDDRGIWVSGLVVISYTDRFSDFIIVSVAGVAAARVFYRVKFHLLAQKYGYFQFKLHVAPFQA